MKIATTIGLACFCIVLVGAPLHGQIRYQRFGTQEELQQKLIEKLESEFLKKARWLTDYDEARGQAEKEGKRILAYFTRSYSP